MRLETILEGVKQYYSLTWPQLIKVLETKYGIRFLDRGKWGMVFDHPSWNYVVKVFDTDNAYLRFVNFVLDNPNEHYPKFLRKPFEMHMFHKRSTAITNKTFYIVKIEKLLPINNTYKLLFNLDVIDDLTKAIHKKQTHCLLPVIKPQQLSLQKVQFDYQNIQEFLSNFPNMKLDTLIPAIIQLRTSGIGKGTTWDLHGSNCMMRSDGTLVITDPFADSQIKLPFFDYNVDDTETTISGPDMNKFTRALS